MFVVCICEFTYINPGTVFLYIYILLIIFLFNKNMFKVQSMNEHEYKIFDTR